VGLSEILGLLTPENALGFALGATIVAVAFATELIIPGPRYRVALKKIERLERKVAVWQRLYILAKLTTEKAASAPELDLEWAEECE
jgi:hypothetical protein